MRQTYDIRLTTAHFLEHVEKRRLTVAGRACESVLAVAVRLEPPEHVAVDPFEAGGKGIMRVGGSVILHNITSIKKS